MHVVGRISCIGAVETSHWKARRRFSAGLACAASSGNEKSATNLPGRSHASECMQCVLRGTSVILQNGDVHLLARVSTRMTHRHRTRPNKRGTVKLLISFRGSDDAVRNRTIGRRVYSLEPIDSINSRRVLKDTITGSCVPEVLKERSQD